LNFLVILICFIVSNFDIRIFKELKIAIAVVLFYKKSIGYNTSHLQHAEIRPYAIY